VKIVGEKGGLQPKTIQKSKVDKVVFFGMNPHGLAVNQDVSLVNQHF
jgi:hypothetical protein